MDPNFNKLTGLNLPQPMPEMAPNSPKNQEGSSVPEYTEQQTLSHIPERSPEIRQAVSAAPPPQQLARFDPPVQPVNPAPASTSIPAQANDTDRIEKEWVEKAKAIVAQTKENPYLQSQELTKFKAEYLKKRYNKVLKLTKS